jgi:hypothetical protein
MHALFDERGDRLVQRKGSGPCFHLEATRIRNFRNFACSNLSRGIINASSRSSGGAYSRFVTNVGNGMQWTRAALGEPYGEPTNNAGADGEVVWS